MKISNLYLKVVCGPEKDRFVQNVLASRSNLNLSTLATNATSQLDVLGHDCDSLGVDGTQVGIFKEANQIGFASFLQSHHGRALES